MKYYWVSQNQTYRHEREGGYLWAPKRDGRGKSLLHWANVAKLEPGDVIFSYFRQHVVAISVAKSSAYEASVPPEWEATRYEFDDGWKVDVEYVDISHPPKLASFVEEFRKHLSEKYSPITKDGKGTQGYLFELTENAAEFLLIDALPDAALEFLVRDGLQDVEAENDLIGEGTDKTVIGTARNGQRLFKKRLKNYWGSQCAVTGASTLRLLRASHTVGWALSSPTDKVNVYNGFLLSPAYDAAFDAHLISFRDDGTILKATDISNDELQLLGIDPEAKLRKVEPSHIPFLVQHRKRL